MKTSHRIHLATVLLEPNRWTTEKLPTFRVSAWAEAIRDAGFAGLELWENHAALADPAEQAALERLPLPVAVFNSYCDFGDGGAAGRRLAAGFARRYGAAGVKFNLGAEPARTDEYAGNLRAWLEELPAGCRALCECHGGTVAETPAQAARALAPVADRVGIIVHAFAGEREALREWLDRFGPAVAHVHVAARPDGATFQRLDAAADEARERLAMLRAAGFAGSWTVEFTTGVARSPEDRHALLANAAADLRFLLAHGAGAGTP